MDNAATILQAVRAFEACGERNGQRLRLSVGGYPHFDTRLGSPPAMFLQGGYMNPFSLYPF